MSSWCFIISKISANKFLLGLNCLSFYEILNQNLPLSLSLFPSPFSSFSFSHFVCPSVCLSHSLSVSLPFHPFLFLSYLSLFLLLSLSFFLFLSYLSLSFLSFILCLSITLLIILQLFSSLFPLSDTHTRTHILIPFVPSKLNF